MQTTDSPLVAELKDRIAVLEEMVAELRDENECLRQDVDGYRLDRGYWNGGRRDHQR